MDKRTDADVQLVHLFDNEKVDAKNVEKYLDAGANPNGLSKYKDAFDRQIRPIARAIAHKSIPIIKLLIERGASLEKEEWPARIGTPPVYTSILHSAASRDTNGDMVVAMLKYPHVREYLNRRMGRDEDTPLHRAVDADLVGPIVVWDLLRAGADPEIPNGRGMTAVDIAEAKIAGAHPPRHAREKLKMVKYPLHYAASISDTNAVRHFMKVGVDPLSTDDSGKTAIDIAKDMVDVPPRYPTQDSLKTLAVFLGSGKINLTGTASATGGRRRRTRHRRRKNSRKH